LDSRSKIKGVAGFEKLDELALEMRDWAVAILEVIDVAFQKRGLGEEFDHANGARPAVRMSIRPSPSLGDVENFGGQPIARLWEEKRSIPNSDFLSDSF